MKYILGAVFVAAAIGGVTGSAFATNSDASCTASGDVVLSARTPQVDLYDGANGKRVMSMDKDKFPSCLPVASKAANMMLEINVNGTNYWVPPHMVNARLTSKSAPICRNLAMGSNETKVGSTRGLGEDCPKPGSSAQ